MAGKFSETGANSIEGCLPCGAGEYSSEGAGFCSAVKAGEEVVKVGELRVDVKSCAADSYSTGSVDSCTPCGSGFSNAGASKCEFCGPGKYMHEEATTKECLECAAGTFSDTGANSVKGCKVCEQGFVSSAGQGERKKSPSSPNLTLHFCSCAGSGFCSACSPGSRSLSDNTTCVPCPAGSMSGTASPTCDFCEVGKFNTKEKSDTCSYCDLVVKGSTTKSRGGTSSTECVCEAAFYLSVETGHCEAVEEGMSANTTSMNVTNLDLEPG